MFSVVGYINFFVVLRIMIAVVVIVVVVIFLVLYYLYKLVFEEIRERGIFWSIVILRILFFIGLD